jgi:hypothetical protein
MPRISSSANIAISAGCALLRRDHGEKSSVNCEVTTRRRLMIALRTSKDRQRMRKSAGSASRMEKSNRDRASFSWIAAAATSGVSSGHLVPATVTTTARASSDSRITISGEGVR